MKKKNKNEIESNREKSIVWNLYQRVKDFDKGDTNKSDNYNLLAKTCIHNGFSSYLLNLFIEKSQCEEKECISYSFIQNCFLKESETNDKQQVEPVIIYKTPTKSKVWIVILAVLWFVNFIIIAFFLLIVLISD